MSGGEIAALAFGIVVIFGSAALAYRYTLSPKAADRMAEANRKYVPHVEQPLTPRRALFTYGPLVAGRVALAVVTDSGLVWAFAFAATVVEAFALRAAIERGREEAGTRPRS